MEYLLPPYNFSTDPDHSQIRNTVDDRNMFGGYPATKLEEASVA